MNKVKFEQNIKEWELLRSENKTQQEKKEKFFYENLIDDVVNLAKKRWRENKDVFNKKFDLLITMSGFSPETSIIAAKVIEPTQVLAISSKNSSKSINRIGDTLVPTIGHNNFHHLTCNPTDPLDIYKLIKNKVDEITEKGKLRAIVDITGGKKIMSAAAGLVAWQLDMPICYIENENYDPAIRRPIPGGENILYLPNPITLYGHEAISKCTMLFNKGQFLESYDRFLELSERIENPKYAKFLTYLSKLYSTWCDVDIDTLPKSIDTVKKHLGDPFLKNQFIKTEDFHKLEIQLEFLTKLAQDDSITQLINFYLLGLFYKNNLKRYDFSCLFFYRAMEGCFIHRLKEKYKLNISKPDYSVLSMPENELQNKYIEISKQTGRDVTNVALPKFPLGYANSAAILIALNDDMFAVKYKFNFSEIIAIGDKRNQSILAHGKIPLKLKDAKSLEDFAQRFLFAFHETETAKEKYTKDDLNKYIENLKFIKLEQ